MGTNNKEFRAPKKTKQNPIEMYFTWYLDELIHYGYLKRYDREPETIKVLPAFVYKKERHHKTKENTFDDFNLLSETNYTYDFRLIWNESALNIFTEIISVGGHFRFNKPPFISHYIMLNDLKEIVSYVDVKPHNAAARFGGGKLSTFYTFPFIQKFLLTTRKLYINKAIPTNEGKHGITTCLFATTFVPNRYLFTNASQQLRKIPFKKTSIKQYVQRRTTGINELLKLEQKKKQKGNQQKLL